MGNGRDKSHDPDGLKDVGLRFKLAGYFSGPSKFSLKRGKKLRDFRDFLERDVERFLHSDATRRELNRAKLHRIKPEEIVKEAMEKIDWLNGVGAMTNVEAGNFWDRVSAPHFRSAIDSIRQRDSDRLSRGRPEERHKFILIRQLLHRFEEFTNLTKRRSWLEIAFLFLIFKAGSVSVRDELPG